MNLALFEPDIPQNTGAMLRLAACFGVPVDVIEPCGFVWSEARMNRAGMDYIDHAKIRRHADWDAFQSDLTERKSRLVLLTTKGTTPYFDFKFRADDTLLMGRESAGVPDHVHAAAQGRLVIPMQPNCRSLNVAQAAAIVTAEALRQTGGFVAAEIEKAFAGFSSVD
jgi:tRNA (cytidine/uridine-2'-O-)-methyltransferase